MNLLKHVNTISARIPGSQSSKIFIRNEIRSYFSKFGLPHIYFTLNPSVTHNPIFQVMVGDTSVDLTSQFPFLVPSTENALRIAQDPVAAADFFEFCVSCVFEYLFGWDYENRKSSKRGGILGHLRHLSVTLHVRYTQADVYFWCIRRANGSQPTAHRKRMGRRWWKG